VATGCRNVCNDYHHNVLSSTHSVKPAREQPRVPQAADLKTFQKYAQAVQFRRITAADDEFHLARCAEGKRPVLFSSFQVGHGRGKAAQGIHYNIRI
jgi:hypothetical protein